MFARNILTWQRKLYLKNIYERRRREFVKVGFLFGAGAELCYKMPSGGKFALDIFRQDVSPIKEKFKTIRNEIDPTTKYAATWLPDDYETRSIGTFGKTVFENIIKDTIEHNRDKIIEYLNDFDGIASSIVSNMLNAGYDVDKSIENIVGRKPDNISMKQKVSFVREFEEGDALFNNRYFSSLLMAYGKKEKFIKQENRSIIRRTILSILQLQLGALSENLSRRINENPFKFKDDNIDIFDDIGDIIQLNYRASGVNGLEYLLDSEKADMSSDEGILANFAQQLLEEIFASVLDYKSLIDSNWHYLYCPRVEWSKFCKICIFLFTVQKYIEEQCNKAELSELGYYDDLKTAIENKGIELTSIATTNYTSIIERKLGDNIHYLNGATTKMYDPYVNKIMDASEIGKGEKHIYVPLLFTQSGTKPMTSIDMSIEYVSVYNTFLESDLICSIGFGFNSDDEHINGVIRALVDKGKKLVVVCPDDVMPENKKAKIIAEKLRVSNADLVKVIYIDKKTRRNGTKTWIELLKEI